MTAGLCSPPIEILPSVAFSVPRGFSCTLTYFPGALPTIPPIPSASLSQTPLSSSPQQLDIQGQEIHQQMETNCAPLWPLPSLGTKNVQCTCLREPARRKVGGQCARHSRPCLRKSFLKGEEPGLLSQTAPLPAAICRGIPCDVELLWMPSASSWDSNDDTKGKRCHRFPADTKH